jgi:predicted DNA-binding protein
MPKLVRIVIQLPVELKTQLDALKQQGYTTSGFIRAMLERELGKMEEQQQATVLPLVKRMNSR